MMRKAILLTAILAVSLLSVLPVSAATSITLSPGGDIQSAIENISDGGTIYLQGGTYYANLIIDAPHKSFSICSVDVHNSAMIDGSGSGSVIRITNTGAYTISLEGVTILDGDATDGGGIYVFNSTLVMSTCGVGICNATNGGGIYAESSDISLQDCNIALNTANYGAGILTDHCTSCTITGGRIYNNTASMFGGGIYNYHTDSTVTHCFIWSNSAGNGGGIYNSHANVVVTDSELYRNYASMYGGGMANTNDSNATIMNSFFDTNAAEYGGGMENADSKPLIDGCTFVDNQANYGAGIRNRYHADATITDCMFKRNTSYHNGGGICNEDYSAPIITNCTFEGNRAYENGGGIHNEDHSTPHISHCTIEGNVALESGGGICTMSDASTTVESCVFDKNGALVSGGAVYTRDADCTVTNCIFASNIVLEHGAGMFNYNSNSTIPRSIIVTNCTFYDNKMIIEDPEPATEEGNALYSVWIDTVVTNCILWDGGESEILSFSCTPVVTYCNVQGGYEGTGIIDADPLFANSGAEDFTLAIGSPCINTGTDASAASYGSVTDDITGIFRPQNGQYDMGAYERRQSYSPASMQPLVMTGLGKATQSWNAILGSLPDTLSAEQQSLLDEIQAFMEQAKTLGNPIAANGALQRALAQMDALMATV